MTTATDCLSDQELSHWRAGLIFGDRFESLSLHIDRCESCQRRLKSAEPRDGFVLALKDISADEWETGASSTAPDFTGDASVAPGAPVTVGDQIGPYKIESLVSRGGMGHVFRARHTMLQRTVALKVLAQFVPNEHGLARRFRSEWRAMGRISDARVVQPTDAGEYHGRLFLAMELVNGIDLGKLVRRCGRLSGPHAATVGVQAAEGLAAVHAAGLVHRDVKPTNLMLAGDGSVRILDLGLAISIDTGAQSRAMTDLGHFVGTVEFTSPEQIEFPRGVDSRTDQYSLGCTLYFLLTGRAPFPSDEADSIKKVLAAHLLESPPPISSFRDDLPPGLSDVIHNAMAREPADRYPSMADFADALRPFAASSGLPEMIRPVLESDGVEPPVLIRTGVLQRQLSSFPAPSLAGRRRWLWPVAAAVAMVSCVVGVGVWNSRKAPSSSDVASVDGVRSDSTVGVRNSSDHHDRRNLFTTIGPHRGFDPQAGHPVAAEEIVIQLDTHAPEQRRLHFLEALPGILTVRYRPDRSGLMKAGQIEVWTYKSEFNATVDPTIEPHLVNREDILTYDRPTAEIDISPGTHKRGFFPVHIDTSFGRHKWNGTDGLQPHSFVFYCYPDLTYENATIRSVTAKSGQQTELNLDVYNRGTAPAAAGRIAVGLQQHADAIADNGSIFADYPALGPGQRSAVTIPVAVPRTAGDVVWYLTFRIDCDNSTRPERDELPINNWEIRSHNLVLLANDTSSVPPNNHGMFRLEIRE